jgi:hypothetical protein
MDFLNQVPARTYLAARPASQIKAAPTSPMIHPVDHSGRGSVLVANKEKANHPAPSAHAAQ